jgi:hypothetical protein
VKHACALAIIGAFGCLGPQVSDDPAPSGDIVAAGTQVPSIDSDDEDAATLAASDNVDGTVPLLTAFADGATTHAWDFGPAPSFAAPMFVLMTRATDGTLTPTGHNPIVGALAGEATYSPFWSVFALVVTDSYHGELITSTTAIDEAVRDGLVEAPLAQSVAFDRPMVATDVELDVGTGQPIRPTTFFYYEHKTVPYFDFGEMPIDQAVNVPIDTRYVLARQGELPLSEPIRGVDMDRDGDIVDSNDIYAHAAADPDRSPLCRTVNVVVETSISSIDTSGDDTVADLRTAAQLFDPSPVTPTVVAFTSTDEVRNCPQQRKSGGM